MHIDETTGRTPVNTPDNAQHREECKPRSHHVSMPHGFNRRVPKDIEMALGSAKRHKDPPQTENRTASNYKPKVRIARVPTEEQSIAAKSKHFGECQQEPECSRKGLDSLFLKEKRKE